MFVNSFSFCETQLPFRQSARVAPAGSGPGLSGCRDAGVSAVQIICDWSILQEAARREQRKQGDPGVRNGSFCLFHADGMLHEVMADITLSLINIC